MTYGDFAYLYDELMKEVPYDLWVEMVNRAKEKYEINGNHLLDLACGTGELSVRLASSGYNITGVDLSSDMLTVAQKKAESKGFKIDFFQQNMADLELVDQYDIIGIFCDSLNYLQTEEEVQQTFANVHRYLKTDGLFIFDVHSIYKMQHIFIDQTFTFDQDDICYIWNCFEGEYPNSVDHELTFFVEDNSGKYDRYDENHTQRTFPVDTYQEWLSEAGFELLETYGDFTNLPHDSESERIFFLLRKK